MHTSLRRALLAIAVLTAAATAVTPAVASQLVAKQAEAPVYSVVVSPPASWQSGHAVQVVATSQDEGGIAAVAWNASTELVSSITLAAIVVDRDAGRTIATRRHDVGNVHLRPGGVVAIPFPGLARSELLALAAEAGARNLRVVLSITVDNDVEYSAEAFDDRRSSQVPTAPDDELDRAYLAIPATAIARAVAALPPPLASSVSGTYICQSDPFSRTICTNYGSRCTTTNCSRTTGCPGQICVWQGPHPIDGGY